MIVKLSEEKINIITYVKPIPKTFGALVHMAVDSIECNTEVSFPIYDCEGTEIAQVTGKVLYWRTYTEDGVPHLIIKISKEK